MAIAAAFTGDYVYGGGSNAMPNALCRINTTTKEIWVREYDEYIRPHSMVFDGVHLWLYTKLHDAGGPYVHRVDPVTGEIVDTYVSQNGVNGNSGLPTNYADLHNPGGVFDGKHVWFAIQDHLDMYYVSLDIETGTMTGYPLGDVPSIINMVYDGDKIWSTTTENQNQDYTYLVEFDPRTKEINKYYFGQHRYPPYLMCGGGKLWMWHNWVSDVIMFDKHSKEFTVYPCTNGVNGNSDLPANIVLSHSCYDGKYIWISSYVEKGFVRLDTGTGTMKGIPICSEGLPEKYENGLLTFDGQYMWFTNADRFVRISPYQPDQFTVEQEARDEQGNKLLPTVYTTVDRGDAHTATAAQILGYTCTGYQLDGGALQPGNNVILEDIQADHTITFVYKPDDGGNPGPGPNPGQNGNCCNCCGSLELKLKLPVCNGSELIEPLTRLVQAVQGCDCHCNDE